MRSLIVGTLLAAAALPSSAQNIVCGIYSQEMPATISSVPGQMGPLRLELGMDENNERPYLRTTLESTINALPGEGYVRDVVFEHSRYDAQAGKMVVLQRESIYDARPLTQGLLLGTIPLAINNPLQNERKWNPAQINDITVTYSLSTAAILPEEIRGQEIKTTLQYTPSAMTFGCSCSETK